MLQLRPRCERHETFGHQALQLLRTIGCGVGCILGIFDFASGSRKFKQDDAGQARHFIRNQGQAPSSFINAFLEAELICRQRVHEKCTVQSNFNDLLTQFIGRAQRHEGHGHLLQIRNVFFQILQSIFNLQCE